MKHIQSLAAFALVMFLAVPAFACAPSGDEMYLLGFIIAPFLALPYTLFGTAVIASQARQWFRRPLTGWFLGSLGAWFACSVGATVGFLGAHLMRDFASSNLEGALILSTPLVFEVAYLMWLHARSSRRSQA